LPRIHLKALKSQRKVYGGETVDTKTRVGVFALVYLALFAGAMASISNGVFDSAFWASVPVILTAEVLVLGMIYMTTFHGEAHEEPHGFSGPKLTSYSPLDAKFREHQKS
jgi:hypothetical protein